jgi:hypothetical protein
MSSIEPVAIGTVTLEYCRRVPALTFEFAEFTVRQEDEAALLSGRAEMIEALQRAFPAALAAWLTRQDDGSWLDVILWRSREDAEEAARNIGRVPEAKAWFGHIDESRGLRHVEVSDERLFALHRI